MRWLSPSVLARTGLQVILSTIFARFADKREQQAGTEAPLIDHLAGLDQVWIDYVSDLGDGFDATATVAHLLAQEHLVLDKPGDKLGDEPGQVDTPRGELLVMGGDEVYPFATLEEYRRRCLGPYETMLPSTEPPNPVLMAVPGNHDWYDGLTSFMRVFAQPHEPSSDRGGWIGGWRTVQRRSYFAVQLPHRWWLWGIDIQLETYIDAPQVEYFTGMSKLLHPGDGVILCCAKPGWLDAGPRDPEAYALLDFFERRLIRPTGANLRLSLTGDHHSYARYVHHPTGEQKVMAGGGGAYLADTHHFRSALHLPPPESEARSKSESRRFDMATASGADGTVVDTRYPSADQSRAEARGFVRAAWRNGVGFAVLLGSFYALAGAVVSLAGWLSGWTGAVVVLALGSLWALAGGSTATSTARLSAAGVHTVFHLAATSALLGLQGSLRGWGAAALTGLAGAVVGPLLFSLYLYLADRFLQINTNELFAGQQIDRYRCFVRIHLRPDADLVVYPVGVDDPVRTWVPEGSPTGPMLRPGTPPEHRLIDGPITITREPSPA